ncbi:MAG: glycosyltransferase family 4 protein, partial [Ignavibacteriales bacterium]|nr:glycosyltransferase family 4 protein [Ignavibacteriales bacterium]
VLILPGAFAARMLGIPHVWHIREIIEKHHISPFLWNIWRWLILSLSARVVCISAAVRQQFGDNRKAVVIHDGIDTELFRPQKSGRSKKVTTFGIVGRLEHRRKGQDTFIEAARIALESHKDLRFVIVGHEREDIADREQSLRETVRRHGLSQQIEFRGLVPREQMPELMHELDVLVLCSKQPEGLGIVLLEAMASGTAVISFAEGGPLDVIQDRVNGLLVPPQNTRGLAEAMLELAGNARLRKSLGAEGRKTVESGFRNEVTAGEIERIYRQIRK